MSKPPLESSVCIACQRVNKQAPRLYVALHNLLAYASEAKRDFRPKAFFDPKFDKLLDAGAKALKDASNPS